MTDKNMSNNSFLEPKFAFLRTTQLFCDAANESLTEIDSSNSSKKDTPIIFTHSYVISGEIIPFSDITSEKNNLSLNSAKLIYDFTNKCLKDNFSEEELKKNPSKLLLIKDAKIRSLSSNQTTNLPVFLLFADQIVGFSFGHLD